jgi:hypothetical protein
MAATVLLFEVARQRSTSRCGMVIGDFGAPGRCSGLRADSLTSRRLIARGFSCPMSCDAVRRVWG